MDQLEDKIPGIYGLTSGFGCPNPRCGLDKKAVPIFSPDRRYLRVELKKLYGGFIRTTPIDDLRNNQRTCKVITENTLRLIVFSICNLYHTYF